jgi:hypothetical protein
MLKCLKTLDDWEPGYAEEIDKKVRESICEAAEVTKEVWEAAVSRVWYDGNYGPITAEDWVQADDTPERRQVANLKDALKIVEKGMGAGFDDIEFYNPDFESVGENEEGFDIPNCVIDGDRIKKEVFWFYHEIYG